MIIATNSKIAVFRHFLYRGYVYVFAIRFSAGFARFCRK